MRYAYIDESEIVNGKGLGVSLYTQGCPFHCKNCFNPETWDFAGGREWTQADEDRIIELLSAPYITRLTILGGEPLVKRNLEPLTALLWRVKVHYPDKQVWLYTGNKYEEIRDAFASVLENVDILIDGRFVDELKDLNLEWRGSSNQRIIDLRKERNGKD